jgi:hypothetical protein
MKQDDLFKSVELAIGADRRTQETWFQYFERLNREGRLDLRACIFSIAVILDYIQEQKAEDKLLTENPFLPIDTRPEPLKKEAVTHKKKSK